MQIIQNSGNKPDASSGCMMYRKWSNLTKHTLTLLKGECMYLLRSTILMLFVLLTVSYGQITITSSDILGLIGESQVAESDSSGSVITVDVGSAGENQTWDLTTISFPDPIETSLNYLSPGDTPFADDFPGANLAFSLPFAPII